MPTEAHIPASAIRHDEEHQKIARPGEAGSLEDLSPSYFALVMATGIVSIASDLLEMPRIARGLLGINAFAYAALWALHLVRAVRHPSAVARDVASHARGPGYFTLVAGTCVLGMQFVTVLPVPALAAALWLLGALLYVVVIYTVLLCLIVRAEKPPLAESLGGGWLVAVVATQAVSLLGGHVYASFPGAGQGILFATLCFWLAGGMLYVWIMGFVFYRYLFLPMRPVDMGAAYWIDMGAVAISTLAGVTLIGNSGSDPLLARLRPFVEGLTLLFWATATWWIPMLILFGFWRHVLRRDPLRYEVALWSLVFPLGMYTVCTWELAGVLDLPMLRAISHVFVYVALAAWAATAAAFAGGLLRRAA